MPVTGQIIDQTSLTLFMGADALAILSEQDSAATGPDTNVIQGAINAAEARVIGTLGQARCSGGTFFKIPFTVGGVALKSSNSLTALETLQTAAHQFAGFLLNRYRAILSIPDDEAGGPNYAAIGALARGWEGNAVKDLQKIIRWTQGFTDGMYVDLDMNEGAVIGQVYIQVAQPVFAGASETSGGATVRQIVNPLDLMWWGSCWPLVE